MKKLLLSVAVVACGFAANSQVVVAGVSPAAIQGNYAFTWADPAGGDWGSPDFLTPGIFVEDTLQILDDGTPGLNPQGNPMSAEGCNPPAASLLGKIAVIYRNTCEFGAKALAAENAGAVAVIIVNREDDIVEMGGGADGLTVTIPVVMLSSVNGAALVNEMNNGPVVMFIGNKVGAFVNDAGANKGELLVSPYGGANSRQFDGFELGIQVYNFGTNDQANVTVTANIDGPGGNVYNEVVGPLAILSGDTVSIFNGNTDEFPLFNLGGIGNYPAGLYTLTYTIDMGIADDSDFDNEFVSTFSVVDNTLALSNVDAAGMPIANTFPSNSTTEYQSCTMVQESNASTMAVQGVYMIPHADTSVDVFAGAEIFANVYQWDDAWVDLDDPNYQFDPTTNDAFQNLNLITFGTHYPASDDDVDDVAYIPFTTPLGLQDGVRYLFCLQTYEPAVISFGYDNAINYSGNVGIFRQPVSPVHVDGEWYSGGWSGVSAPSMALRVFDPAELGLTNNGAVEGRAYPNPANDVVTVALNATGDAVLTVSDVTGKIAMSSAITLANGTASVSIADLASGVYTFHVALASGEVSTFSVVKK